MHAALRLDSARSAFAYSAFAAAFFFILTVVAFGQTTLRVGHFPNVTHAQALDVALCWGWIDGIRKGFDERSFLQRFTPRGARSTWSQINVDNVARLIEEGRMTEHGLKKVEEARADGRWARAYNSKDMKIPADLQAAVDAEPRARAMLAKLSAQNRFALAFRVHNMKTEAGRKKKIEALVAMLKRGETIHPQGRK